MIAVPRPFDRLRFSRVLIQGAQLLIEGFILLRPVPEPGHAVERLGGVMSAPEDSDFLIEGDTRRRVFDSRPFRKGLLQFLPSFDSRGPTFD